MTLKQVVAAKDDERFLFLTVAPFQQPFHSHLQVVVGNPPWYSLKVVKGLDVPVKERFLFLSRKGLHELVPARAADRELLRNPTPREGTGFSPGDASKDRPPKASRSPDLPPDLPQ